MLLKACGLMAANYVLIAFPAQTDKLCLSENGGLHNGNLLFSSCGGSNKILEVRSRNQSDTCYLDPRF